MSENKRDYQVGRGKPPVHSRFKKGQFGNPRGPLPEKLAGITRRWSWPSTASAGSAAC